jgi:hypothetical protein
LNLGNTADYNFNIPTTSSAQLYPTGISSVYSQPPNKNFNDNRFGDPFTDPNHPLYGTIDPVPNFKRPPGG